MNEHNDLLDRDESGNLIPGTDSEYAYRFTEPFYLQLKDSTEYYRPDGKLSRIKYRYGREIHIRYEALTSTDYRMIVKRGNKELVIDFKKPKIDLDSYFNIIGINDIQPTRIQAPNGDVLNYHYGTEQGTLYRLESVTKTGANGDTETLYAYLHEGATDKITGIIDQNGNRISSVEYQSGLAISSEVGLPNEGAFRTVVDRTDSSKIKVTNALGKNNIYNLERVHGKNKVTLIEGEASENCIASNQAYTYSQDGFITRKTDWNGIFTDYKHNHRGLEIERIEAADTPEERIVTTEWHPTFSLPTKISEPARETIMSYDLQGRLISRQIKAKQ